MTIKLTKPYILEGKVLVEGTELVIASDGEVETVNKTPHKPENEADFIPSESDAEKAEELAKEKAE